MSPLVNSGAAGIFLTNKLSVIDRKEIHAVDFAFPNTDPPSGMSEMMDVDSFFAIVCVRRAKTNALETLYYGLRVGKP